MNDKKMSGKLNIYKVTLESGKTVCLRELKIKHQELAVQAASRKSNGDTNLLQLFAQKELLKILICNVDGRELKAIELEDLDSIFTFREFVQLNIVLSKITGIEGGNNGPLDQFQFEVVNSGGI